MSGNGAAARGASWRWYLKWVGVPLLVAAIPLLGILIEKKLAAPEPPKTVVPTPTPVQTPSPTVRAEEPVADVLSPQPPGDVLEATDLSGRYPLGPGTPLPIGSGSIEVVETWCFDGVCNATLAGTFLGRVQFGKDTPSRQIAIDGRYYLFSVPKISADQVEIDLRAKK